MDTEHKRNRYLFQLILQNDPISNLFLEIVNFPFNIKWITNVRNKLFRKFNKLVDTSFGKGALYNG